MIIVLFLFNPNFFIIKVLETSVFFSFIISYLITVLINPGIPNRDFYYNTYENKNKEKTTSGLVKCNKCNICTPKCFDLHHCEVCNVCVMQYDHHCPWTGKCIGKYNIISFYFFIFFLFVYIFMSFITFLMFIINLQENEFRNKRRIKNLKL